MQILSDNDYNMLNSFQTEMQTSCNFLVLLLHKVHSIATNRNLDMLLEVYTNMIKSNFTVLNSVINVVPTNHVC